MTFVYNPNIPAANNNPSNDQPDMLVNTQSISDLIEVDHVGFNDTDGGKHLQITYESKNTPAAQTDPQSVLYTVNGIATTVAEVRFRNQSGIFPMSLVKAYGLFSVLAGSPPLIAVVNSQQINIDAAAMTTSVALGVSTFNIPLLANTVTGDDIGVMIMIDPDSSEFTSHVKYSFTNPTLSIQIRNTTLGAGNRRMTVMVFQL